MAHIITLLDNNLERRIYVIRGVKVMLDTDLAYLYGTTTKAFNQAVKRNLDRFPPDFRFELTEEEFLPLRSRAGRDALSKRNVKHTPAVFTEHGVAMLSGVLKSPQAIQVNIAIMRAFNRLREAASFHADFVRRLEELELQHKSIEEKYDGKFDRVFEALRELMRSTDPNFGSRKHLL